MTGSDTAEARLPPPGDPRRSRSSCGVGVLVDLSGERTHDLVEDGFRVLENLDHRGARGAEENTGDGAGMLVQKPHDLFADEVPGLGGFDTYGVGQAFLPRDAAAASAVRTLVEAAAAREGFDLVGWRDVPTDNDGLGETALRSEPAVAQFFVEPGDDPPPEELDRRLYVLRQVIERAVEDGAPPGANRFYVCSLDRRKVVYKGLLTNAQLRTYYPDLSDRRFRSSLVFVHARFSTNTLGAWELAHPYRGIIHNGEINTLRGNLNWMRAREADLESPLLDEDVRKLLPVTREDQSDTAIIDNVLELLIEAGRDLPHALRMLVPEAWERDPHIDPQRRAWYDYHASIVEPWDGPALIALTDGEAVAAILDRNGLRPCRYAVTIDDRLVMASEAGVLELPPERVVSKGRLRPGQLFYASPSEGRIVPDGELFERLTDDRYGRWLAEHRTRLADLPAGAGGPPEPAADVEPLQSAFGYTIEGLDRFVAPMAADGKDPIGSMGDDAPPSVLSDRNKPLFSYFAQLFAQVSNPPIDYIREDLVTSLESRLGRQRNLLGETPEHCRQVVLESPILTDRERAAIGDLDEHGFPTRTIDLTFPPADDLEDAVEGIRRAAAAAIEDGAEVLVLTDRAAGPDRLPIPSLLGVAAVHHHLVRRGLRIRAGIVLDTGGPYAVHHFCTLLGYGADAIHPWLAYRSVEALVEAGTVDASPAEALAAYRDAVTEGIQKVMSKMGISTLQSYKGAQIFEAVGLAGDLVEEYFEGTAARTGGIDIEAIERDVRERHDRAFREQVPAGFGLDPGGDFYWRREGEFHQWNPATIGDLQRAARSGDPDAYRAFAAGIDGRGEHPRTLRGLLAFDGDGDGPIPLDEVEPVESIVARFFTAGMSFGSLSAEAHETLAIAMNRLGGMAGSGEGGEPVERFGTERECGNKQVASGRFGVTNRYLAAASRLEIKMAQGSKPGEGGHLPGRKVNEVIAETRHTTPGVSLISPPPHHDIYSIEDLAQLIHDLKSAGPDAEVHVKLVSEAGVGIIAAGVAKARADAVLISGASGGTGASPKTSIKSAGLPWELGLAETQRVLLENDLRSRIRVRVDGGLKTGRDVAVAALLGAEAYGFGTAALVACGCVMLRKCQCNTCSVGIATQDPELRKRFPGAPEHVMTYLRFVAEEVRTIMARLGFRTMDEMIGRADRLVQRPVDHPRARGVDLSPLLSRPESRDAPRKTRPQRRGTAGTLDRSLVDAARPALDDGRTVHRRLDITNRDRTVGAQLSAAIARRHGEADLPDDTVVFDFVGSAGQSFGAFLAPGVTLSLVGEANDYVGKGLSGGKLVIRTPPGAGYRAAENVLIGNVALYGATGGEAYVNGVAGERFAVRNSGVQTVVEGVGDHGCEYMTGGVAVVLGETGRNFAAGMSGGEAYVLDETGGFTERVNPGMVSVEPLSGGRDRRLVRRLVENHARYTGSERAADVLDRWDAAVGRFVKVMPDAYADVIASHLDQGRDIRVEAPPEPPVAHPALTPGDD